MSHVQPKPPSDSLWAAPLSRRTDPDTSRRAADELVRTGKQKAQQAEALRVVREHPGLTSLDLAAFSTIDRYALARRLPELRTLGLVRSEDTGKRGVLWREVER